MIKKYTFVLIQKNYSIEDIKDMIIYAYNMGLNQTKVEVEIINERNN